MADREKVIKGIETHFKGRRMSDAESMGMLFDDPPDISVDAFIKWCSESHMMGNATLKGNYDDLSYGRSVK